MWVVLVLNIFSATHFDFSTQSLPATRGSGLVSSVGRVVVSTMAKMWKCLRLFRVVSGFSLLARMCKFK